MRKTKKVKDLLNKHQRWTKSALARDNRGNPLSLNELDKACRFCLNGAVIYCYPNTNDQLKIYNRLQKILQPLGFMHYTDFNDHPKTTFKEVEKLIKEHNL